LGSDETDEIEVKDIIIGGINASVPEVGLINTYIKNQEQNETYI
jgi:hypothetical protein